MKKLKYFVSILLLSGISTSLVAQDKTVGKFMYSNERSYVVIAVLLTILGGLILYMVRIDRRLSKLEKEK
jgi:heme export protein D (CcmD)